MGKFNRKKKAKRIALMVEVKIQALPESGIRNKIELFYFQDITMKSN